jgi:[ribosomal protein S5]-alanine N-acetyltransferase
LRVCFDTAVIASSIAVRPARADDAEPLAQLYRVNRDYLAPYEPVRDDEFFTADGQRKRLTAVLDEREHGRAYPYVIEVAGSVAGRITVTNVARGPFRSGTLGYWVAQEHTGRGVATHAVRHVADDCFAHHELHRLEAATLVDNIASQKVLRRVGFTLIGPAPRYLHIAGDWRDHLLFQLIADVAR